MNVCNVHAYYLRMYIRSFQYPFVCFWTHASNTLSYVGSYIRTVYMVRTFIICIFQQMESPKLITYVDTVHIYDIVFHF